MSCADTTAHASLEQLFTGELSDDGHVALRAHAQSCPDCRAAYDRLTRIEAQLEHAKSGLPRARLEFLQSQVMARAASQQAAVGAMQASASQRPSGSLWSRLSLWLLPAGGLALAGVLAVVLLPNAQDGVDADGYQARGSAAPASTYGVRAFCIAPEGTKGASPKVLAEARSGETLKCAVGNRVQFAYTTPKDAKLTLAAPTPNGDWLTFTSNTPVKQGTDLPLSFSTPVTDKWLEKAIAVKARFEDPANGKLLGETTLTLEP